MDMKREKEKNDDKEERKTDATPTEPGSLKGKLSDFYQLFLQTQGEPQCSVHVSKRDNHPRMNA